MTTHSINEYDDDDCQYELIPIGVRISESPAAAAVVSEELGDVKSPAIKSGNLSNSNTQSASSAYDIGLYVSHRKLISDDIKFTMLTKPW